MKILIYSDLHTEFAPFAPPNVFADVVVLAGDIGVRAHGLAWAKAAFRDVPVVYVPGNHEYYGAATPHLTQKLRVLAEGTNVTVLDEEAVVVGGVRFLGATLWTDYALFGIDRRADCEHHARTKMTDHQRIRVSPAFSKLTPAAAHRLHRRARMWLAEQLATPHAGATVVVTHHAPSARSLPPQFATDLLSAAYASNLEHLLTGAADLWIHGHTHFAVDYVVGGTRVVSNQRGYPDEPAVGFRPAFIVEVPSPSLE